MKVIHLGNVHTSYSTIFPDVGKCGECVKLFFPRCGKNVGNNVGNFPHFPTFFPHLFGWLGGVGGSFLGGLGG